jgi:hypothetical protein
MSEQQPPPIPDLLSIFEQKDIVEMDDTELITRLINLQEMRKIHVVKTRRKTAIDKLLHEIDITKARIYLEVLGK